MKANGDESFVLRLESKEKKDISMIEQATLAALI